MKFLLVNPAAGLTKAPGLAAANYNPNKFILDSEHHFRKVCFDYKAIGLLSRKTKRKMP
jgi:hypothetical protein